MMFPKAIFWSLFAVCVFVRKSKVVCKHCFHTDNVTAGSSSVLVTSVGIASVIRQRDVEMLAPLFDSVQKSVSLLAT